MLQWCETIARLPTTARPKHVSPDYLGVHANFWSRVPELETCNGRAHRQSVGSGRGAQREEVPMVEKRLADLDWKPLLGRSFHPSPLAWEDQMLYFLLPDRFSDSKER